MAINGAFASPILGMLTQSSAFGTISQNISNMNTGGYKATNTRFSTILASKYDNNHDVGGVQSIHKTSASVQGRVISTTNPLDMAINGMGMFVLNTRVNGNGETLYTRDGGFQIRVDGTDTVTNADGSTSQIGRGYLVDKNGHFVQGWEPDASGQFSTSSALVPVRLDHTAFSSDAAASTAATLAANLPAQSEAGDVHVTKASVYDADGDLQTFELVWTRQATPQTWTMHVRSDTEAPGNLTNASILGASTTPAFGSETTFTFDGSGHLAAGTSDAITINYADGSSAAFDLDVTDVTSIGSSFHYFDFQKDGRGPGNLLSYRFDELGQVLGTFSNGVERALYKLPLATFVNADGLEPRQGNLFAVSVTSGDAVLRQVRDPAVTSVGPNAEKHEFATFVPFAHELSNSNLEQEFSLMIMTQQAYNSSATVFKTIDEMMKVASDLKT